MYEGRLTSLRGLASIVVVVFHALLFFRIGTDGDVIKLRVQFDDPQIFLQQLLLTIFNGGSAVLLFFVLSGCVLAMSLERAGRLTPLVLAGFYIRRGFRIYPALWVSILLGAASVGTILAGRIPELVTQWNLDAYYQDLSWKALLGGALGADIRLNQPLWSLTVELFYSLMFPLIFIATRQPVPALATLILAIVLLVSPLRIWSELNLHMLPFVAGALIPSFLRSRIGPAQGEDECRSWALPVALAALALLLSARPVMAPMGLPKPLFLLCETIGATALVYMVLDRRIRATWLDWRPFHRLGEISYSIYVLHFPPLFLLGTAAMHLVPHEAILDWPILANLLLGLATLAVTLPVAALCHRAIERPGIATGRQVADWTVAMLRDIGNVTAASKPIAMFRRRSP